jgi:hypothetical protein
VSIQTPNRFGFILKRQALIQNVFGRDLISRIARRSLEW